MRTLILSNNVNLFVGVGCEVFLEQDRLHFFCATHEIDFLKNTLKTLGLQRLEIAWCDTFLKRIVVLIRAVFSNELVIGDYRRRWVRYLWLWKKIVIIDDGSNSLFFNNCNYDAIRDRKNITFLSCFNLTGSSTVDVSRRVVEYISDHKRDFSPLPAGVARVILGSCEAEMGWISQEDWSEKLREVTKGDSNVWYKPHRRECEAKIISFSSKIIPGNIPIELYDLSNVTEVFSSGSTSLSFLTQLYPKIRVTRIDFSTHHLKVSSARAKVIDELFNQ